MCNILKYAGLKAVLLFVFLAFCPSVGLADPAVDNEMARIIAEREAIAQNAASLSQLLLIAPAATGFELAEALDIPQSMVLDAVTGGPLQGNAVFQSLGVIDPIRGNSFVLLSSGVAGTNAPEPGVDFGESGTPGDRVTLTLTVDVPDGVNRITFSYNFLSAEYPDFIGTVFNDTFTAVLTDASGTREMARASVNSSAFFAVSGSRAGGSGFDIFTEDPSGVDEEFGTGLPDAGLTDFQYVEAQVQGGDTVTLEFSIEDRGDGILDSAVIIDNVVFTSLEAVDPNPELLENGEITNDKELLAVGGEPVEGAASDGITRVLLRNRVSGFGIVEFCLEGGNAPQDGGIDLLGGDGRSTCVTAAVEETTEGFIAFAVYRTPDEFNRGGDENLGERPLTFRATFTPDVGGQIQSDLPFMLVRPPVVLVHGLWSKTGAWTFPLATDFRFDITLADYRQTNASWFSTNSDVGGQYAAEALTGLRLKGVAATQIDYAGHSMGGILGRIHATLSGYENPNNFNEGDINKLITINTPHTGSPWGNVVNGIRAIPIIGGWFESAMRAFNHPVDEGALDDLAKGSSAINALQQVPVPGHAIVGIGGSSAFEFAPGWIGNAYIIINFFAEWSDPFQGLQHDFVVGRNSQEGGLPASAYTVFDGLSSIHTAVTGSNDHSDRVIELFNSSAESVLFANFPAASTLSAFSVQTLMPNASQAFSASVSLASDLVISSPAPGTVVASGDTVHVVVDDPNVTDSIASVLLVGPGVALVDAVPPFEFDLVVPNAYAGTFTISAIGNDGMGGFVGSNEVDLLVAPPATLTGVSIIPQNPILLNLGEERNLIVIGGFDDGIDRDISDPSTGTEYLTADTTVVTVSDDGVVTSVGAGVTTVVARNGDVQDSISVTVFQPNAVPSADAGPDMTVMLGSSVQLDGTESIDQDDGPAPLSFSWLQTSGPGVFLDNPASATPSFTPNIAGEYVFSLVVSDGQTDSLPDSVTITVVTNQPPVALCQNVIVPAEAGTCSVASVSVNNGSYDPDGDPITLSQSPAGLYGLGDTVVTLTVTDDSGASDSCTAIVTVIDNTPPTIDVSVSPDTLWPPNHKMVLVTPTITVADNCDSEPALVLSSITVNEGEETDTYDSNHDSTIGDGHTTDDIQVDESGNIYLRAERSGAGNGRIYTITYSATDASGNISSASAVVSVPHNQ